CPLERLTLKTAPFLSLTPEKTIRLGLLRIISLKNSKTAPKMSLREAHPENSTFFVPYAVIHHTKNNPLL
ncbi:MAG: hypothetical protein Q4G42_07420, partial [Neisseria sp.]|nr:hypothetical protein [Neisseria sp.]